LPDHTHCLWILPEEDADFPSRWRDIKTAFSKSLPGTEQRSAVMIHRGERGIWQRRYWEHTIRDDRDYAIHMDYIHFNPVKHALARAVFDRVAAPHRNCSSVWRASPPPRPAPIEGAGVRFQALPRDGGGFGRG